MIVRPADEKEWHVERRRSIGGSDAPAVMGVAQYTTAFRVALEKLGKAEPQKDNESMLWGNLIEPLVRAEYAKRSNRIVDVDEPFVMRRSDRYPFMHATLDGVIRAVDSRGPGVLQVKTSRYGPRDWEPGSPLRLSWQVQHQHEMIAAGFHWGSLAVLSVNRGFELHWWDDERNTDFEQLLIETERRFVADIAAGLLPAVDGSDDTSMLVKRLHPLDNGRSVSLDAKHLEIFEEWEQSVKDAEAAEKRLRSARNALQLAIGDNTFGVLPNGARLSYRTQRNDVRVLRRDR